MIITTLTIPDTYITIGGVVIELPKTYTTVNAAIFGKGTQQSDKRI